MLGQVLRAPVLEMDVRHALAGVDLAGEGRDGLVVLGIVGPTENLEVVVRQDAAALRMADQIYLGRSGLREHAVDERRQRLSRLADVAESLQRHARERGDVPVVEREDTEPVVLQERGAGLPGEGLGREGRVDHDHRAGILRGRLAVEVIRPRGRHLGIERGHDAGTEIERRVALRLPTTSGAPGIHRRGDRAA